MIAIVMAGGKGERMSDGVEKPLIKIGNKTLLERVTSAIKASGLELVVAVSGYTPQTKKRAEESRLRVIETPGEGYVKDVQFLLSELDIDNAMVVSSDLPFITSALIQNVVKEYNEVRRPVCVTTSLKEYEKMGCKASVTINNDGQEMVPVGVNVVEKTEQENHFYKINGRQTLNVNTAEEIEIARRMLEDG